MQDIKQVIKETYGSTALQAEKTGDAAKRVAQAFGYSKEDLEAIPKESNMGLSCGNPLALASLKEGEVVVDLGSGGGLDCFLAAKRVGSTGRVIGVDMTPAMIELATSNAKKFGKDNVEFRQGEIEHMPVEDNTVDCVISNCVINLSTDKQQVFNEVFRVLKPGGRLAVSDICLKKALPTELKEAVMAYVGCISGALLVDTYKEMMQKAGFGDIDVVDSHADLNVYATLKEDGGAAACCASTAPVGCCGGESKSAPAASSSSCCTPAPSQKSEGGGCCGGSVASKASSSSSCCTPAPSQKSEGGGCCGGSVAPAREEKGGACCGGDSSSAYSSMKGFGEVVELLKRYDVNEYAGSFKIFAVKPHNN